MMHTPNRAEIEAELIACAAAAAARRLPRTLGVAAASRWDEAHQMIDWLLYDWELAD